MPKVRVDDSREKVREVVLQLIQKDSFRGDTYSILHSVAQTAAQRTKVDYDTVMDVLKTDMQGSVVVEGKRVMLTELYEAEAMIADRVRTLMGRVN